PITREYLLSTALIPEQFKPHEEHAFKPCRSSRSTETSLETMALLNNSHFAIVLLLQCTNLYFSPTQGKETIVPKTASEPCGAKFGPLPSKWQMTSLESRCVVKIADRKLKILQGGSYQINAQVAPNTTYQEIAPFEVQLLKNKDILQTVTDKSKVQYVGMHCELHAEDTIELIFNGKHQVLENNTYLEVFGIGNITWISLQET
ncbi:Tumor necrosis factor ligand superfamily member 18, partial [Galemys pyrenaicus]